MKRILVLALVLLAVPLVPARAAGGVGQFVLRCLYSHTNTDDPIVFPGQPGASHMHDFFGNTTVDAHSTMSSMLAGDTTCRVPSDTAGYWAPTASLNGVRIEPTVMRIYYLGPKDGPVLSFPPGLQIIGGNRDATSPEENPHVAWYCGATKDVKTPRMGEPYDCTPWSSYRFVDGVIAIVDFPSCWNGTGLRPEDVAYPVHGRCPSAFRHAIPKISERIHYGIMNPLNPDGTPALTLSSGPAYTMHADFWNTWQQERLDQLVADCIAARVHCGSVDATSRIAWTQRFGTTRSDLAAASAPDGEGGSYVVGSIDAAVPGQGRDRSDAFLRRYDADGELLWARRFGTSGADAALAVSVVGDDVYVAGSTRGRFRTQDPLGGLDAFVARFGSDGAGMWVRQLGTRRDDEATGVVATGSAVFLVGSTQGRLKGSERPRGGGDAFAIRFGPSGDQAWLRQFGGAGADRAEAVALRGGVLTVVGASEGLHGSTGRSDAFVATFGIGGTERWSRLLGSVADDGATSVAVRADSVFVAGWTTGTMLEQVPAGGIDAFVAKLSGGRIAWLRQFGTAADDDASALVALGKGLYVAGSTAGEMPDGTLLGATDGFLRKYGPGSGSALWTMQLGTADEDRVHGLAGDRRGVVLVGATLGAFDGSTGDGDRDAFAIRVAFT